MSLRKATNYTRSSACLYSRTSSSTAGIFWARGLQALWRPSSSLEVPRELGNKQEADHHRP